MRITSVMWLWPDSLVGRTVVVLLAGVLLSNVVGVVVYSGERLDLLTSDRGHQLAERVAAAVSLLEDPAIEGRQRALRPLRGPGFRVFWSERPAVVVETDDWRTRLIRRALLAELDQIDGDRLRLTYNRPQDQEMPVEPPPGPGGRGSGSRYGAGNDG